VSQLDLFQQTDIVEPAEEVRAIARRLPTVVHGVPDALWPTNNPLGIPLLNPHLQAHALDLPFTAWGTRARRDKMTGTYHFYVDDYRFTALWKKPEMLFKSKCVNAIEANFTCSEQMPMAVGIYRIYQKRWLARYWQSGGVYIFVDLNVHPKFYEVNMMGVPRGWTAWATRGYNERTDRTIQEWELACTWAETSDILFIVYGGGKDVRRLCMKRGWIWVSEQMDVAQGRDLTTA